MRWSRALTPAVVGVACAACGGNGAHVTAIPHTTSAVPVGCLDPRGPGSMPAGGWVPDPSGASDYEPENAGTPHTPSPQFTAVAARVAGAVGRGFGLSVVLEYATSRCGVDLDVTLHDPRGDCAFVRVLQLSRPVNDGSFPLVGSNLARHRLADGSELLTNHVDDNSNVEALLARSDGLLVVLLLRSSTGQDTSGWPTTMATMPSSAPPWHPR